LLCNIIHRCYTTAKDRKEKAMKVTTEMVMGTFTFIAVFIAFIGIYGDRQNKPQNKH
jgi:hypothetical protein